MMKIRVAPSDFVSAGKEKQLKKKIEVPEEAAPLVKELARKYELDFEAVAVGGDILYFLHLADISPLVAGRDIFANAAEFPFWVKIWEASVMMANLMASLRPVPGARVLELGAGLAVPGIAAAAHGHDVTVTDYEDYILDFVRVSASVNGCGARVTCKKLDWLSPESGGIGRFDCIIGSEILFHEKFFEPLRQVIRTLLAPGGVVFMAHNVERKSLAPFLRLCAGEFSISAQKKQMVADKKRFDIVLNRMVRKTDED
jgi:predicted nicotinamide N-methyase